MAQLQPTAENADEVTLTGWLHLGDRMRLYSSLEELRRGGAAGCVSVQPLSMAGVVPPGYEAKRMTVRGRIERSGATCASGLTVVASDISVP